MTPTALAVVSPTATAQPTAFVPTVSPIPPTYTSTAPPPTITATSTPTAQPILPTKTATPTATPTATLDPYADFSIDALTARSYGGGELVIEETLARTEAFTRYLIHYPSDGLKIYGAMTVPHEGWGFPVALVLHGYIDVDEYEVEAYSTRYADALAEAGYLVIHPNYRNHPPSDTGEAFFRIGYAVDVLNLMALVKEQSLDETGPLRRADGESIHLMGHSMGGGIALRVMTIRPKIVKATVLYASMTGDEARNFGAIYEWSDGRTGAFELAVSAENLRAISPVYHFDRLQTPISIHHSRTDQLVPVAWSEELCEQLESMAHPVECFFYNGYRHTFHGAGDEALIERMVGFFGRY